MHVIRQPTFQTQAKSSTTSIPPHLSILYKMPRAQPPLSEVLPPLILGTASFNYQFNEDPHKLPTVRIIETALNKGIRAFDTSPYYGADEEFLGAALKAQSKFDRTSYFLQTKVGRIAEAEFDYSPAWIRKSVMRSCERLGTDYLDTVLCHDVEFVSGAEV